MKRLLIAAFAVAAVFALVLVAAPWDTAEAVKPDKKGNDLPFGRIVYRFNLIGTPQDLNEDGCGNGRRIFVNWNASHAHILVTGGDSWEILDCVATNGDPGEIQTDGNVLEDGSGDVSVWVRLLAKPTGTIRICSNLKTVHDITGDFVTYCELDESVDITLVKSTKFSVKVDGLFDTSGGDLMWKLDPSTDFRIAQFVMVEND